jgi:hypothetical protein
MFSEWSNYTMGAISLFPLAGAIPKLRGFYPRYLRSWFVTFSTIFSLIVYIYVQWYFENLDNILPLISVWLSFLIAIISLFVYLGIHLTIKPIYSSLSSLKKTSYIIVTMIFYFILIISLTYSFNILENYKDYQIISGIIKLNGQKINISANVVLNIEGEDELFETKMNGKFFIIIKKEKFKKINTITFYIKKNRRVHSITKLKEQFYKNKSWEINLK